MKDWLPYLFVVVVLSLLMWVATHSSSIGHEQSDRRDMRDELQHFVIRLGACDYIAYWTYSYDRSLRLIHAADCPNRGGHVFILSDGSITTRFGGKNE